MSIFNLFKRYKHTFFSLVIFHIVLAVIFFTNFRSTQYFVGWDALSPELNISANVGRAIFAGWQENYGMGALGGHGFAATLPHVLIVWLLSLVFPQTVIRTVFTLLCFYAGGLGMFFLAKKMCAMLSSTFVELRHDFFTSYIALVPALFYLFNLATTQIFYIQLEAFIIQFACLPWLFGLLFSLLEKFKLKTLFIFFLLNFIVSLQGFIPSLFVAYSLSIVIMLFFYTALHAFSKDALRKSLSIILIIAATNLYWFLPFGYYTFAKGADFLHAYNNLITTPQFIAENQKYGNFHDVLLLKSFFLDGYQLGGYVFQPWLGHIAQPLYLVLSYTFVLFFFLGILSCLLFFRKKVVVGFVGLFVYFFGSMGTQIFPFSTINTFLSHISPTYEQAFRTTFSKFGIGLAFCYSVFLLIGVVTLAHFLLRLHSKKRFYLGFVGTLLVMLTYIGMPHFTGHTLFSKLFVDIPQPYQEMMNFFKQQGDGRIAQFPQDCAEGWYSYTWGYFGSGFLWYGVKQPFAERSFDVWSKANENYYWEMTAALQEHDFARFDAVIQKYNIKWLVFDPNLVNCRNKNGYNYEISTLNQIQTSPDFRQLTSFKDATHEPITIFENTKLLEANYLGTVNSPLYVPENTGWSNDDHLFQKYGSYITDKSSASDLIAPFSNLFSKRNGLDSQVKVLETADSFSFTSTLQTHGKNYIAHLPDLIQSENTLPAKILFQYNDSSKKTAVTLEVLTPQLAVNGQVNSTPPIQVLLGEMTQSASEVDSIILNEQNQVSAKEPFLMDFSIPEKIELIDAKNVLLFSYDLNPQRITQNAAHSEISIPSDTTTLSVTIPKIMITSLQSLPKDSRVPSNCNNSQNKTPGKYEISEQQNNNFIRFIDKMSSQCLGFGAFMNYPLSGSLLTTETRHVTGNQLELLTDVTNSYRDSDEYLAGDDNASELKTHYFITSSIDQGKIFSVSLKNTSFNSNETINDISLNQSLYFMPKNMMSQILLTKVDSNIHTTTPQPVTFSSTHPNETFYTFSRNTADEETYLTLNQSFDKDWLAINTHNFSLLHQVKYRGWANAWLLPSGTYSVIIFYWPQLFIYVGFLGLLLAVSFFAIVAFRSYRASRHS